MEIALHKPELLQPPTHLLVLTLGGLNQLLLAKGLAYGLVDCDPLQMLVPFLLYLKLLDTDA